MAVARELVDRRYTGRDDDEAEVVVGESLGGLLIWNPGHPDIQGGDGGLFYGDCHVKVLGS